MKRQLSWDTDAWGDYVHWQQTDKQLLKRINELIKDCLRSPVNGIGEPEAFKADLRGYWLHRITDDHRLGYKVDDEHILIIQCRFHD
ncbi:Txe/YoeB family addiction module toxin [Fibrivirga algicola]|uniref:Putative mRNA interferase YoeB n=1 Tax=Fibrivirga algicola TaxID=2950420 RepID=A0ABX0QNB6_9BACT|nr:Txe/YoeB family addiction module toxin [Fibrivirga algicola]NID12502.1 Txe/YoeB family addiction module toxin [Fibrivirga algicola]